MFELRLEFVGFLDEVHETEDEGEDEDDAQGDDEEVEELVVPPSDAAPEPGAVVVEPLDAVVAAGTVRHPGRPVDEAGLAVLQLQRVRLDVQRVRLSQEPAVLLKQLLGDHQQVFL